MVGKVKSKKKAGKEDSAASFPNVPEADIMSGEEATPSLKLKKKMKKKRLASEREVATLDDSLNAVSENIAKEDVVEDDLDEPTMGEKIASLNMQQVDSVINSDETERLSHGTIPPNASSINILLRQALRADDRALLLDCLYTQDEKVIANSVAALNSSDVLKLLRFLLSNMESRGAILACTLPWLKNLLLQHASGVMSQESSLQALNSLYQVIKSRVSTFSLALDLSSRLDFLYTGVSDDISEENETIVPVIYEDDDDSDEGSDDSMQTDHESNDGDDGNEFSD